MSLGFPSPQLDITDRAWVRYLEQAHNMLGLAGAQFPLWSNLGMLSALSMTLDPGSAPGLVTTSGGLLALGFDAAASESLHAAQVLSSGYERGVSLRPHVRWMPTTVDAGVVRWGIEYAWSDVDATPVAAATIYVNSDASGVALGPVLSALETIDGNKAYGPGSVIQFRVFRDAADAADTYPADAILLAAGFVTSNNATGSAEVKP
jgi:hypothetical protein